MKSEGNQAGLSESEKVRYTSQATMGFRRGTTQEVATHLLATYEVDVVLVATVLSWPFLWVVDRPPDAVDL